MKTYTRVNTKSANDRNLLIGVLIEMGYVWHRGSDNFTDPLEVERGYPHSRYPIVNINPIEKYLSGGTASGLYSSHEWPENACEIFENILNIEI